MIHQCKEVPPPHTPPHPMWYFDSEGPDVMLHFIWIYTVCQWAILTDMNRNIVWLDLICDPLLYEIG